MLDNIRIYDERGQLDVCHICGQPATTFVNISVNCASGTPSVMKPVCNIHNPYKFTWNAENAAMREIVQAMAKDATIIETKPGVSWCAACLFVWGPDSHAVADEMHSPDCPVTKARAILAEQPDASDK